MCWFQGNDLEPREDFSDEDEEPDKYSSIGYGEIIIIP